MKAFDQNQWFLISLAASRVVSSNGGNTDWNEEEGLIMSLRKQTVRENERSCIDISCM